jgi:predicted glycogen debranching enzyme
MNGDRPPRSGGAGVDSGQPRAKSEVRGSVPGTRPTFEPTPAGAGADTAAARARGGMARPAPTPGIKLELRTAFETMQIRLDGRLCRDLTRSSKKEWLLTNGLGGYAMSTLSGLNTRRYHGLLVAAMRPPVGRAVVLSKMDETLQMRGGPVALDTSFYPGVVHPRGFEYIEKFILYPFPTVVFSGPGWRLEKTIHLVHGENTVVSSYKMLPPLRPNRPDKRRRKRQLPPGAGPRSGSDESDPLVGSPPDATAPRDAGAGDSRDAGGRDASLVGEGGPGASRSSPDSRAVEIDVRPLASLRLRVRPLFAFREAGELTQENDRIQGAVTTRPHGQGGAIVSLTPYPEWEPVYLVCPDAGFVESPDWYKNVEYPQERYRGLEYREDLWTYGYFETELRPGQSFSVACTLHHPDKRVPGWPIEREIERRSRVLVQLPDDKPFTMRLGLAAEQFVIRRERDLASLVAGYPWLADSSRDTMISLPGLLLVTGRYREAKSILRTYARALDRGMLPNKLPEGSERPEFGSVDATLWFFIAVFKYLQYTGDFEFVKTELRIPMLEIVRYYTEGARYGIRIDGDGMLRCGEPGRALTWMDARIGDQPVTPRAGKRVDVNALWYNALRIMERLAERFSIPHDMARFGSMAERIEDAFHPTFWNASIGCLNDGVDFGGPDGSIRPNQVLAVSLPFPLLDSESAQSVVRVVGEKLLTPLGLRSLDADHPDYKGVYDGDVKQRHAATHQGSAWAWLIGQYVSALVKANGGSGRVEAAKVLRPFEHHLTEDCLGQISEIFWGNAPHWPRGCPAHAPAVAEIFRAYYEDVLGKSPGRQTGVPEPTLRPR